MAEKFIDMKAITKIFRTKANRTFNEESEHEKLKTDTAAN